MAWGSTTIPIPAVITQKSNARDFKSLFPNLQASLIWQIVTTLVGDLSAKTVIAVCSNHSLTSSNNGSALRQNRMGDGFSLRGTGTKEQVSVVSDDPVHATIFFVGYVLKAWIIHMHRFHTHAFCNCQFFSQTSRQRIFKDLPWSGLHPIPYLVHFAQALSF
jgi:hypothetical protein